MLLWVLLQLPLQLQDKHLELITHQGSALTNVTPSATGTTAVTDFSDLTFSTATITARGCMIYNDTNSDKAVATIDFGGDKTSTAGDFTIVFPKPSTAIIRIA